MVNIPLSKQDIKERFTEYGMNKKIPTSKELYSKKSRKGLPTWDTLRKKYPSMRYDQILNEVVGSPTFEQIMDSYFALAPQKNVRYDSARHVLEKTGMSASPRALSHWLSESNQYGGYTITVQRKTSQTTGKLYKFERK